MSVSIPVILGTGREGRESEKVARFVHSRLLSKKDVLSEFVDVRDYVTSPFTIPAWEKDKNALKWRKIAQSASGFVFVVPEYNRSFPGEFKLLFDSAFKEYEDKPAVLVGVSSGQYGGVRVIQQLIPLLLAAHIIVLGDTVATSHVSELFSTDTPTDEKYVQFVDTALDALIKKVT